jgi:hypothetical protein
MPAQDFADWTAGIIVIPAASLIVPAQDFPDWTDGYLDITGSIVPGQDFPDWTKALGQPSHIPVGSRPPVFPPWMWFDATKQTGTTSGSSPASITDWSGNNYDIITVPAGVTWVTGVQNSLPAYEHAVGAAMHATNPLTSGAWTIYTAFKGIFGAGQGSDIFGTSGGGNRISGELLAAGTYGLSDSSPQISGGVTDNNWHQIDFQVTVGDVGTITVDGSQVASGTMLILAELGANCGIGSINPLIRANCNWGEFLFYNTSHSGAQLAAVRSYLKTKWGTP